MSRREWSWRSVSLLAAVMVVVSTTFLISGGSVGRPVLQLPWLGFGVAMVLFGLDRQRRRQQFEPTEDHGEDR